MPTTANIGPCACCGGGGGGGTVPCAFGIPAHARINAISTGGAGGDEDSASFFAGGAVFAWSPDKVGYNAGGCAGGPFAFPGVMSVICRGGVLVFQFGGQAYCMSGEVTVAASSDPGPPRSIVVAFTCSSCNGAGGCVPGPCADYCPFTVTVELHD